MRSWLSVLITDAKSKKGSDIPIAPSLYSLSNKMDNSLLAVRDINHKYIVVESIHCVESAPRFHRGSASLYIHHAETGDIFVLHRNLRFYLLCVSGLPWRSPSFLTLGWPEIEVKSPAIFNTSYFIS